MDKQKIVELAKRLPKGPYMVRKSSGIVLDGKGQVCLRVMYVNPEHIAAAFEIIHELAAEEEPVHGT